MILHRILFKLYHIQQALSSHAEDIRRQNDTLATLREEQQANEDTAYVDVLQRFPYR